MEDNPIFPYLFLLVWIILATSFAVRFKGFQRVYPLIEPPLPLPFIFFILFCFLAYLSIQMAIVPLIARLILCGLSDICTLSEEKLIILTDIGIILGTLTVLALSLLPKYRRAIWGVNNPFLLIKGASWWLLAFPLANFFGNLLKLVIELLVPYEHTDQVAVSFLKELLDDPLLFAITGAAIILLVPLAEEIVFRGGLFNYLRRIFPFGTAAFISGFVFSAFHFALSQGVSNIVLLFSLTILGMLLAWVYERENSLWASLGLHCIFNLFGVLSILLGA